MTYIRNFDFLELIPIAHTNIIEFVGMPPSAHIIATRHEKGTFTILTYNSEVMTWSVLNAKQVKDIQFVDLSKYLSTNGIERTIVDFQVTDDPTLKFKDYDLSIIKYNDTIGEKEDRKPDVRTEADIGEKKAKRSSKYL